MAMADGRGASGADRTEQTRLWETLRAATPTASRRDLMRWSAVVAGAAATARLGIGPARSGAAAPARQDAAIVQGAEISVPFDAYGQDITLDPHRSADYGGFWVMYPNVWAGLLGYDENGRVVRDLAADAVMAVDGLSYTFTIREGATFASGNPVVAGDFVASWQRALDPANPSPMAGFMRHVAGYDDWLNQVEGAQLGFEAIDDLNVIVSLSESVTYFPSYMASFVWAVVDPVVLADAGDVNFVLNGAGAGPWQFSEFEVDTRFVMTPNPNHTAPNPSIASIAWPVLTGPTAAREALDLYIAGEAVSADVPLSLKAEVDADPALVAELVTLDAAPGSVRSLAMDFRQPPFDDARVRLAFAQAFDRDRYAEIYANTWVPAAAFTPPVVTELSGYAPPAPAAFDVDAARQLLADAGYPNGEGFPEVILAHPSEDTEAEKQRVRDVLQMLGENLGVTLLFDGTRTLEEIEQARLDTGGRQLDIVWWQTVTDTPHLLTEVFSFDSPYMQGAFNWAPDLEPLGGFDPGADAQAFADLVSRADLELDPAARNDLFRQAEELVNANAVYVPIAYWTPQFVQKPTLQGTRQGSWTGRLPALFDANVVVVEG